MRQAVIDMGTNTYHLMIVDRDDNASWTPLLRHRIFVKMGEDGLQTIGPDALKRSLDAMKLFKAQIDAAGVPNYNVHAFGTAALRAASNSKALCSQIFRETGIEVEVISGDKEAEAIYRGVRTAVPFPEGTVLIMDIGGGSVEFIIANRTQIFWQHSFDIGVSILYRNFHKSDPIAFEEVRALTDFLDLSLKPLTQALQQFPCSVLIGASGAFDTIDLFLLDPLKKPKLYGHIKRPEFDPLYQKFLHSSLEDRHKMEGLSLERLEMIVVAQILVNHVLNLAEIKEIYTSEYSLKEGMLAVI
jgi:exopolyphosphatase / guanosine-5'-triphosphate,3'-diphosphate pyrophosphatase